MTYSAKFFKETYPKILIILLIITIIIGVVFRFVALDQKVFWHDEVYTIIRASGFTSQEINGDLFQNRPVTIAELQRYQQVKPGTTPLDTLRSLAIEEPQHPPLYFLLARLNLFIFGNSVVASRFLPAIISLLALPLMYGLAWELFGSTLAALLGTAFVALSPLNVLFAQVARQYSFLFIAVIAISYLLLRAIRLRENIHWGLYSFVAILGLYTHPLFSLTLMAHGAYILLLCLDRSASRNRRYPALGLQFLVAVAIAIILYLPWIIVTFVNFQQVQATTNWTTQPIRLLDLIKTWIFIFTALFLDVNLNVNSIWVYLLKLPVLILILWAIYQVGQQTSRPIRLFILTSIFIPFLVLALPDLLTGGLRSAIPRFLIPCFPGIFLAVTYLFASSINNGRISLIDGQRLWRSLLALTFTVSFISCVWSAVSEQWWNQYPSLNNAAVARILNQEKSAVVITDFGDEYTNTGDMIALSYLLGNQIQFYPVNQLPSFAALPQKTPRYAFRPSQSLRQKINTELGTLQPVDPAQQLWIVDR